MLNRLEHVVRVAKARGLSQEALATEAGLSPRWLNTALSRARTNVGFRPEHESLVKLAGAAAVSLRWLEDGEGDPGDGVTPGALPPRTVAAQASSPARLALVEALRRNPAKYSGEDFLAALDVVRDGEAMLPDDPEEQVAVMARMLRGVSKLRAEGRPVSLNNLAWSLASTEADAAEALNAEGLAELRALGGEPPKEPVKTPPRGVPAVPRTLPTKR